MGFFQNTCKPEGLGGKIMVATMNIGGHAALAKWGLSYLPLPRGGNMMEIGCGGGANVARILKQCPDGKVTGIDYALVSVQKSRKVNKKAIKAGRCAIRCEDVRDLPFGDNTFDAATAFETMYFWQGLAACFSQVYRVLKKGGKFFICNESDGDNAADRKWESIIRGMKIYSQDEIVACCKQAGFSKIIVHRNRKKHWICFIAEK